MGSELTTFALALVEQPRERILAARYPLSSDVLEEQVRSSPERLLTLVYS